MVPPEGAMRGESHGWSSVLAPKRSSWWPLDSGRARWRASTRLAPVVSSRRGESSHLESIQSSDLLTKAIKEVGCQVDTVAEEISSQVVIAPRTPGCLAVGRVS